MLSNNDQAMRFIREEIIVHFFPIPIPRYTNFEIKQQIFIIWFIFIFAN